MTRSRWLQPFLVLVALVTALALLNAEANARPGGGSSFGSRGSRTFTRPPATQTAPNTAAPIERSTTQPGRPSTAPSGFFNRPGLLGGLLAGFLGAGLFGLLFGHGLFGNLGGFASIFGLLLQLALIAFLARLVWGWWQRRSTPAYAGASMLRGMMPRGISGVSPQFGGSAAPAAPPAGAIPIGPSDYDAFERLLGEIQAAYSAEDLSALRTRATPEMVSYFAEDLAANAARGVVNRVSNVKLLQGDLAEAWRERDSEYATVAMRFSLVDAVIERDSGRVVEGDSGGSTEAKELWTFRRVPGGPWLLSAIQQAS